MRKTIYEYEFKVTKGGKSFTVQQSETTRVNAVKRIQNKIKGIDKIVFVRKYTYPHLEGGKRMG